MRENHSPFQKEELNRASMDTSIRLIAEFNLVVGHGAYHYAGDFYGQISRFENKYPVVLFDVYGYIIIESEHEFRSKMNVNETIHVPGGISRMIKHIKYSHEPMGIKNYEIDKNKAIKKYKNYNIKLSKLQKEKDSIEQLLLRNKNIVGHQIERFREYQENKLKNINIEIFKIENL